MTDPKTIKLGGNVVRLLLPHRQPLLMVDAVESCELEPPARLVASKYVSLNEPVLAGHFPGFALWPGIYTIEGLGQSCQLLATLYAFRRGWAEAGADPDEPLEALEALERAYRLMPTEPSDAVDRTMARLRERAGHVGVSSLVQMKLLNPVFPGSKLRYEVELSRVVGQVWRFEVAAFVGREAVARGQLGVSGNVPPIPR